MLPPNDYDTLKHYKLNLLPVVVAKAEERRLLVEAGVARRAWFTCQVCRSVEALGRLLVTAGQRVEMRYAPLAIGPHDDAVHGIL